MAKWSSMRNGLKFRSLGVPTLLLTRAPAPSDCSTARNDLAILRGATVVRGSSGMTGRPRNMVVVDMLVVWNSVFVIGVICLESLFVILVSMYSLL
jgi:LSD1 subclass zinc finger protein